MRLEALPEPWLDTRETLQRYAMAMTAFPRAGAEKHPHWSHVAMDPIPGGFTAMATPLADGATLGSILDLHRHRIIVTAGEHSLVFDLTTGPSPRSIGTGMLGLVDRHGGGIAVDEGMFAETSRQTYDAHLTTAFITAAEVAVAALDEVNDDLEGEVHGPHLWPHGFDVATEWISPTIVDDGESTAHAQITTGWYPGAESYVYVNPWPFSETFTSIELPHGASWNTDGWFGAKLAVPREGGLSTGAIADVARSVHHRTARSLGG
jgi:hypothetical protein